MLGRSKSFIRGGYGNHVVVNEEVYKKLYWLSRYHTIHRLITHCTNIPEKSFRVGQYVIHKSERV